VIVLDERKDRALLGDRSHRAYPAIDPDGPDSRLYVRDHRLERPPTRTRRAGVSSTAFSSRWDWRAAAAAAGS
jgi:hypothetical protein